MQTEDKKSKNSYFIPKKTYQLELLDLFYLQKRLTLFFLLGTFPKT